MNNNALLMQKNAKEVSSVIWIMWDKLKIIFSNRIFIRNLNDARNNWLELPIEEVLKKIYIFFKDMEKITV